MGNRLEGRAAIVTGAGRGIGREEALALAAEGASVIVNDFGGSSAGEGGEAGPADEVVSEIRAAGGEAAANYANVTDYNAAEAMVKQALDTFGRFDILVNNAGILRDRMIFNMSEGEWDSVIAVHLKGHFNLTRAACIQFRQQRSGVIVNTSSESGLGNMGQANYSAAKEGIVGLTRTIARDMGRYGVRCNAIRPRAATRMTLSPELQAAIERSKTNPSVADANVSADLAALATMEPKYVAPFVVWLCTDEAANVNGRNFLVGGNQIGLYSEPDLTHNVFSDRDWTVDLVSELVPKSVTQGLRNRWTPSDTKPS
ncbi:MAG: SDR family NAD(P)-dependent oxidoreductase [Dehalococcoidia bacterium]|nr:SDR family NAD(P)-dependent oxidoreductase [Dehalococcoidia bacterium]